METVIILMMLLVSLSFILKLTFMRPWQMILEAVVPASVVIFSIDIAVLQSKTQIEEWFQTPELMLDLAVILTIDVALQLAFCFFMVNNGVSLRERVVRNILLLIPGLLIFPTVFYLLVLMIFSFTGIDFNIIGYGFGIGLVIIVPLISMGMKLLLPERFSRLELIFYLNCIIGMLGVVATVNGRTATVGVNELNIPALLLIFGIGLIGYVIGFLLYKHKINKSS